MLFLDFEKPLENLFEQLEKLKQVGDEGDIVMTDSIKELEKKIQNTKKDIYANLTLNLLSKIFGIKRIKKLNILWQMSWK